MDMGAICICVCVDVHNVTDLIKIRAWVPTELKKSLKNNMPGNHRFYMLQVCPTNAIQITCNHETYFTGGEHLVKLCFMLCNRIWSFYHFMGLWLI